MTKTSQANSVWTALVKSLMILRCQISGKASVIVQNAWKPISTPSMNSKMNSKLKSEL